MTYADFGRYLTQQRELRGLSREEVSQSTRIPGALIAALEEGELSRLPGRVFVVNYIRAYADEIGLSSDEAVLRFEEVDQALQERTNPTPSPLSVGGRMEPRAKAAKTSADAKETRGRAGWLLVFAVVAVLLVMGALAGTGHLPLHLLRR